MTYAALDSVSKITLNTETLTVTQIPAEADTQTFGPTGRESSTDGGSRSKNSAAPSCDVTSVPVFDFNKSRDNAGGLIVRLCNIFQCGTP